MKSPREKASELISEYISLQNRWFIDLCDGLRISHAKECASKAVDEMIKTCDMFIDGKYFVIQKLYLEEVKHEIENYGTTKRNETILY